MKKRFMQKRLLLLATIITLCVFTITGCGEQKKETGVIKIGVPGPYSGSAAEKGTHLKYGAELAAEEINNNGGILGNEVELVYADTENKVEVGVSAYQKLLTVDNVDFIVGEVSSSVALAALDVIAKYKAPTIYAIPSSDELGKKIEEDPEKYGTVFMTDPPISKMQDGVLTWVEETLKKGDIKAPNKTIALIAEDSDWGRIVTTVWKEKLESDGWNVVLYEIVPVGETDFYPILTKISELKPDLLKIEITSLPSGVALTKQLAELDIKCLTFGGYYQKTVEYPELVGDLANYNLNIKEPFTEEFEEKLLAKFPDADPVASLWSYDSLYILKEAIERAGTLEADKVVSEIEKTDYKGVCMRTVFDPKTHFAKTGSEYKFYGVCQYKNGSLNLIYPEDYAQTEFELPPHLK